MTKKKEDVDRKMAAEYRDVTVETASENLLCYMTNSRELISKEVLRLDIDFQGENLARFFRPLPDSMKALIDKMEELHCRYSITGYPFLQGDEGFMVLQKEGKEGWYVPLKFLKSQKKYALVSRRNIRYIYPDEEPWRIVLDGMKDEKEKQAYIRNIEDENRRRLDRRTVLEKAFKEKDVLVMGLVEELARKKHELSLLGTKKIALHSRGGLLITKILNNCKDEKNTFGTEFESYDAEKGCQIKKVEESFWNCLDKLRTEKGMSEAELCRKAGMSRQEYYKISNGKSLPNRMTVIFLAFSLGLGERDTESLLASAGYSLMSTDDLSNMVQELLKQGKSLIEAEEALYQADLLPGGRNYE